MSASCLSIFMLGFKLPVDRLVVRVDVRGCGHEAPTGSAKFCPECGSPMWKVKEDQQFFDSDKIGDFTVRTRDTWTRREHIEVAYIGTELKSFIHPGELRTYVERMHFLKMDIEAELTKYNIRFDDADPFGLHLVAELC